MKRLILCFIFSWVFSVYGEDHQSISLSWRPALNIWGPSFDGLGFGFKPMGGGLEYTQQMDALKWGVGLEYPSYHSSTILLSLQGAWAFQRQSQWMAVLGLKLSGGTSPTTYWQKNMMFYISPLISFEYFLDEKFSLFTALHIPLDYHNIFGGFYKAIPFEIPVGVRFYF